MLIFYFSLLFTLVFIPVRTSARFTGYIYLISAISGLLPSSKVPRAVVHSICTTLAHALLAKMLVLNQMGMLCMHM